MKKQLFTISMHRCIYITTLLVITLCTHSFAQVYSNKEVGKKNQELADSLKKSDYPYSLPIWGDKATKAGYNLPYSAGLSVQYIVQESDLIIDNLQVGFNNGTMHNMDEIIRFDKATSTAEGINIRPDIWLFPFLNIYGIFAQSTPSTEVGYGIWIPDSSDNWHQVLALNSKAEFDATSMGFGITPTIGVGGGWLALDMNFTWTDISALEEPAFAFVFGPRAGKTFKFKKPERNIAIWVGGFRLDLNTGTKGSLPLGDVLSTEGFEERINNAQLSVDESQQQVNAWWNDLSGFEQNNPVNKAKYEAANKALSAAGNVLNSASTAVNNLSESTVQYSLDKRPKDKWNFIVGSQFQLNKHWMIRGEYGFLGSRTQFIGGLQYRFGL